MRRSSKEEYRSSRDAVALRILRSRPWVVIGGKNVSVAEKRGCAMRGTSFYLPLPWLTCKVLQAHINNYKQHTFRDTQANSSLNPRYPSIVLAHQ